MEKAKRKEREFNLRRAEILEQAEKIFAEKGFYNTTVAEIAAASGFAIGTLYQFFAGKEQLYTAMITEKLTMMYERIRKAVEKEAGIFRKIEILVVSNFQFVENNADFCSIFVRGDHLSLSEGSVALRDRMMRDYADHVSFIEELIREGIRTGDLKKMDPRMMAAALLGIINSCSFKWLTVAKERSLETKVPFVMDIFLQGVRRDAH
ncbi:MAG: TetR/AcrR family transcriptional regulator [Deltaproteobacteria bacterium]|nr:TetR/AcrR family transcriptional regulator [Deltaproteobacteria bacterium]